MTIETVEGGGARGTATAAGAAALATAVFLVPLLRLWKMDVRVPFNYSQADANAHELLLKTTVEQGWYEHNPLVGAPDGLNLHAFPMPDNLHLAIVRVMSVLMPDADVIYNVYYLIGYPLAAATAAWAMCRLGVRRAAAVSMGVLYALLPYHFGRGGNGHLFLAAYFVVPPIAERIVCVAVGRPVVRARSTGGLSRWLTATTLLTVAAGVLVASASGYYAVFAAVLAVAAALVAGLSGRWREAVIGAAFIVAVLGVTQLANLAPDLVYRARHPEVASVGQRSAGETEYFALKFTQLVLPIAGHRVAVLGALRQRYDEAFPLPSEGNQIPLGAVGTSGFVALLGIALAGASGRPCRDRVLRAMAVLTAVAFVVATVGGLSSLVGLLGLTQVRGWNRLVVYLAFFALTAVGLAFSKLPWAQPGHRRRFVWLVALAVVTVLGVLDQTTNSFVPNYRMARFEYQNDAEFVGRVEAALPARAQILQLPYVAYPEEPPQVRMNDYDHLRGYLHSDTLRWSYGSIKGTDQWKRELSSLEVRELPAAAAAVGFDAIWVDRFGYADGGESLEASLRQTLGPPLVSGNKRMALFALASIGQMLDSSAKERLGQVVRYPTLVEPGDGVHQPERDEAGGFRWTADRATVRIRTPRSAPRLATVSMRIVAGVPGRWTTWIDWPDGETTEVVVPAEGVSVVRVSQLPPGISALKLRTTAPRVSAPGDGRDLRLRVYDLSVDSVGPLLQAAGL